MRQLQMRVLQRGCCYVSSEEEEDNDDFQILTKIPEDTIEDDNDPKTHVSKSNIDGDGDGAGTDDGTAAGAAAAEKEDPRPNKMLRSTIVNSVSKRGPNNIEDAVDVADKEIQDLKDEIEEFCRDYEDVISSTDLRTLHTIKKLLTVGTVLTPGDYRALRPIRGQFMWGAFNLMQRYRFLRETCQKTLKLLLKMMTTFTVRGTY
nr:uncharacterized protein LOC118879070 [Drosophila suzukii]